MNEIMLFLVNYWYAGVIVFLVCSFWIVVRIQAELTVAAGGVVMGSILVALLGSSYGREDGSYSPPPPPPPPKKVDPLGTILGIIWVCSVVFMVMSVLSWAALFWGISISIKFN